MVHIFQPLSKHTKSTPGEGVTLHVCFKKADLKIALDKTQIVALTQICFCQRGLCYSDDRTPGSATRR